MAPVFIGAARPVDVSLAAEVEAPAPPPPSVVDGAATPDVMPIDDTLDAPLKAGAPPVADGVGEAVVLLGLRTLRVC